MKRQLITFAIFFVALLVIFRGCSGNTEIDANLAGGDIGIATLNNEYKQNQLVSVKIKNNTNSPIILPSECPEEPLDVFLYQNGNFNQLTATPNIDCSTVIDTEIPPLEESVIEYRSWNHALFNTIGRYKIGITTEIEGEMATFESNEFTVSGQSWWGYTWGTFFYQPIYNALIYIVSIMPGYNLGLAIILLTILLRLLLFIPAQRGLESQRKLQDLQPRIKKLQEKYKNNQQKIAQETFALYKEYKVNPFGSCLPLVIQLPILIALFYVIQTGLNPDNVHLLYSFQQGFDLSLINTNFFGLLNLTERNIIVLPLIVAGLQFFQMKLATARKKNQQQQQNKKQIEKKKDGKPKKGAEMEMATQMMVYIMPIMIALFTASVPSGVGLYWGTSTIFGIGQQLYVNKRVSPGNKNKSTVRVIEKDS
ncbi:YidC/Oxa1 family membrane protein insertase [Patescibacteria group bacterium]